MACVLCVGCLEQVLSLPQHIPCLTTCDIIVQTALVPFLCYTAPAPLLQQSIAVCTVPSLRQKMCNHLGAAGRL